MLLNLLYINLIVALIHLSGFIENIDERINRKWKFRHLPYPLRCGLCLTWWLSLLCVFIMGKISLLAIVLCLVNAHLNELIIGLLSVLKNAFMKVIETLDRHLY